MAFKIGKLIPNKSVLLLCDMQDRFSKSIQYFDQVVESSRKLAEFAQLLNIHTFVPEHNQGKTTQSLTEKLDHAQYFEKTQFSMCTTEVMEAIKAKNPGSKQL